MINFDDQVFNMIWTAGFNAGLKVTAQLIMKNAENDTKFSQEELHRFADELIKKDAQEIKELIRLKMSMGN